MLTPNEWVDRPTTQRLVLEVVAFDFDWISPDIYFVSNGHM
jgi:hypothetical protein